LRHVHQTGHRSNRVSAGYEVSVEQKNGTAISLEWKEKEQTKSKNKTNGVYFIRTSYKKSL
jgi:hypothetical protein